MAEDITERLRRGFGGLVPSVCDEAANQIDELRKSIDADIVQSLMKENDELKDLLPALRRYGDAYEAAQKCPDMILSSGKTEEAVDLMRELEEARESLFKFYRV